MTVLVTKPEDQSSQARQGVRLCGCLNCGVRFQAGPRRAEFCGRACIREWNNRRMVRGAEVYDLLMILRFDRDEAYKHKVWTALTRLAKHYREQDENERAGRRSWRRLRSIIETRLFLWSERWGGR